jgi:hypothetical protein
MTIIFPDEHLAALRRRHDALESATGPVPALFADLDRSHVLRCVEVLEAVQQNGR